MFGALRYGEEDEDDFEGTHSWCRAIYISVYGYIMWESYKLSFHVAVYDCLSLGIININMINYLILALCGILPFVICALVYYLSPVLILLIPCFVWQWYQQYLDDQAKEINKERLANFVQKLPFDILIRLYSRLPEECAICVKDFNESLSEHVT